MKFLIVAALLAVAAHGAYVDMRSVMPAAPVAQAKTVAILKALSEADEDGGFNYNFESEDEIKVEATGSQRQVGPKPEDVGTVSRGSYSYVAPDGQLITLSWTADEHGFRPVGSHLPVAPPMPDYVVEMLANMKNQKTSSNDYSSSSGYNTQQVIVMKAEEKASSGYNSVQEVRAPAPQPQYAQQEVKTVQKVSTGYPAPAQQKIVVKTEEVRAAPAPQVQYVQQETRAAAPAPQMYIIQTEERAAPAPQVQYIIQTEERAAPAPQVQYVIQTEERAAPAPAPIVRSTGYGSQSGSNDDSVIVMARSPAKSSSGRQIFRVTFPESASK